MALATGTRLGPYEIVAPLGAGGMGEVYRARDTRLDRTVAIKVLAPELASDHEFRQRFHAEARAISQLTHPHICTLHDIGEHEGTTFLVMELLAGETLADRLARGTQEQPALALEQALQIGIQIADALAAAHAQGIVHRDLKPGNIMLTKGATASAMPHAKLLDFGLAKNAPVVGGPGVSIAPTTPPQAVTAQGSIVGTIQYMAPEQVEGGVVDARTDIFALGSVLYELLTGRKAFEGKSQAGVMAAILEREPPAVSALQPRVPALVEATVRKCLAKHPDERWQSAADLATALRWTTSGSFAMASPHTATIDAAPVTRQPRRRFAWTLVTVLMLALGAAIGWTVSRLLTKPSPENRLIRFEIPAPPNGRFVFGVNTGGVALSPDGSTLAFVASVDGRNSVWMRRLAETTARSLAGTEGASYTFWSPDGSSVGFVAGSTLKRTSVDGGLPILICRVNALRGAAWLPNGEIAFGSINSGLQKVAASGGTPVPFTTLDGSRGEGFHGFPQVVTEDTFLYFARASTPENTGVWIASFDSPADRVFLTTAEANALVSGDDAGARHLLWTRGGTLLAQRFDASLRTLVGEPRPIAEGIGAAGIQGAINASASNNGVLVFIRSTVASQLTWFDRTGKVLSQVGEPADYTTLALSPDGQRLVASRDRPGGSDLWLLDIARGGVATLLSSRGPTSSYPVWSPDATQVVFASDALLNLFRKQMHGAGEEQRLTRSNRGQLPLDWSPDGGTILLYQLSEATGRDLMTLSAASKKGISPAPYVTTTSNEWWAQFAPVVPTRWTAYQSDESGQWEIYIDTYPTPGGRRRVSTGGGQFPMWGPQGKELFYVAPNMMLMSVAITFGSDSVDSGAPGELFRLPAVDTGRRPYVVAPDGRRFLVRAVPSQAAEPLTAIVNWPSLLRDAPR